MPCVQGHPGRYRWNYAFLGQMLNHMHVHHSRHTTHVSHTKRDSGGNLHDDYGHFCTHTAWRVDRFHFFHHSPSDEVCRECCDPFSRNNTGLVIVLETAQNAGHGGNSDRAKAERGRMGYATVETVRQLITRMAQVIRYYNSHSRPTSNAYTGE